MKLRLLSAKDFNVKLKAKIQSSGYLGFTVPIAKKLGLTTDNWVKFAEDDETNEMYLAVCGELSEDAFSVKSSCGYFYVLAKNIFDTKGWDYIHQTIIFDLVRANKYDEVMGGDTYKMNKRIIKRKKSCCGS